MEHPEGAPCENNIVAKALEVNTNTLLELYNKKRTNAELTAVEKEILQEIYSTSSRDIVRLCGATIHKEDTEHEEGIESIGAVAWRDLHQKNSENRTLELILAVYQELGIKNNEAEFFIYFLNQNQLQYMANLPRMHIDAINLYELSVSPDRDDNNQNLSHYCDIITLNVENNKSKTKITIIPTEGDDKKFNIKSDVSYELMFPKINIEEDNKVQDICKFTLEIEVTINKSGTAKIEYKSHSLYLDENKISTLKANIGDRINAIDKKIAILKILPNKNQYANRALTATAVMIPALAALAAFVSLYVLNHKAYEKSQILYGIVVTVIVTVICAIVATCYLIQHTKIKNYERNNDSSNAATIAVEGIEYEISSLHHDKKSLLTTYCSITNLVTSISDLDISLPLDQQAANRNQILIDNIQASKQGIEKKATERVAESAAAQDLSGPNANGNPSSLLSGVDTEQLNSSQDRVIDQ